MAQSFAQLYLHLVFSTHQRIPYLEDRRLRGALHRHLASACTTMGCPSLEVGGVADHVHLACSLSRTMSAADLVRRLKKESSKWLKREYPEMESFYWQQGYGAFTVSPSHLKRLSEYIRDQEARHRSQSFQEEFRALLDRYEIRYDEASLWD